MHMIDPPPDLAMIGCARRDIAKSVYAEMSIACKYAARGVAVPPQGHVVHTPSQRAVRVHRRVGAVVRARPLRRSVAIRELLRGGRRWQAGLGGGGGGEVQVSPVLRRVPRRESLRRGRRRAAALAAALPRRSVQPLGLRGLFRELLLRRRVRTSRSGVSHGRADVGAERSQRAAASLREGGRLAAVGDTHGSGHTRAVPQRRSDRRGPLLATRSHEGSRSGDTADGGILPAHAQSQVEAGRGPWTAAGDDDAAAAATSGAADVPGRTRGTCRSAAAAKPKYERSRNIRRVGAVARPGKTNVRGYLHLRRAHAI